MSTLNDFIRFWGEYAEQHEGQRMGQSVFNAAHFFSLETREVCNHVWMTDLDPFNHDDRVEAFLEVVARRLECAS